MTITRGGLNSMARRIWGGGYHTTRLPISCVEELVGLQGSIQSHSIIDELLRCKSKSRRPISQGGRRASYSSQSRKKRHMQAGESRSAPTDSVPECVMDCHSYLICNFCGEQISPHPILRESLVVREVRGVR